MPNSETANIDKDRLLDHLTMMRRIRAFEEAAERASLDGRVGGAVHLSIGQEAIAAGVCAHLGREDRITTTHRGHGHAIAKGTDPVEMMLELFGRAGGTCNGKGGSMHIADFSVGMLGANGVVAAGIPIAVGAAHGAAIRGETRVVVCFFGDGAINRGPFLEGLNWARIFNLPVIFVCEMNGFASTTRSDAVTAGEGAVARARSLDIESYEIDGNDVMVVDGLVGDLVTRARSGEGPFFVGARTYRLKGHTSADKAPYRPEDEVEAHWRNDPIGRTEQALGRLGVEDEELRQIEAAAAAEMQSALDQADAAPWPAPEFAFSDVQDIGAPVFGEGAQ